MAGYWIRRSNVRRAKRMLFLAALVWSAVVLAVDLGWDRNPSPGVVGYRLFYGPWSRVYTNAIDTGGGTVVRGIPVSARTFFSVVAHDADGMESDFSDELVFTPADELRCGDVRRAGFFRLRVGP